MPVRGNPENLYLGRALDLTSDTVDVTGQPVAQASGGFPLKASLRRVCQEKFDFVVLPLAAPNGQGVGADFQPSVDSALVLDAKTWNTSVVGVCSEELSAASAPLVPGSAATGAPSLPSAKFGRDAQFIRSALETELRWAAHLGLRGVLLPSPGPGDIGGFARTINELLLQGICDGEDDTCLILAARLPASSNGWKGWNHLRTLCDHHPRLAVALEFTPESANTSEKELERWIGEPIKYVLLPSGTFVQNKQGYPVLPKRHKELLSKLFSHQVQVIMEGSDAASAQRMNYVARLYQSRPPQTVYERFACSHKDTLQAPLQPLADNLESETYELFEEDPVKYAQYEQATLEFLKDRLAAGKAPPFVIMVLGAGRGPLVAAALRAAERAGSAVTMWAVEKNPNAIHALRHRKRTEPAWQCVEVVHKDMRQWEAPRKADCIISELLGSWGDNELSPECLDGAQRVLAEDGVCIPQSYVSLLAPVSCPRVWEDARSRGEDKDLDMGYVVHISRAFYPCSGIKEIFEFKHPNWALESNERHCEVEFQAEVDGLIHGFAGYFDSGLYGTATLSITPGRETKDMFSWFPMFFPLKTPVFLRKGETLRSHWWRRCDDKKVWYEWALSEPYQTAIQNPNGRAYRIDH